MRTMVGHSIRVATLLGFTLAALVISAQAQEIMNNGAVTGDKGASEDKNNEVDFENAKPLPMPAAPDSVAAQAEKDLIDNLTNNRSSNLAPAGQEAGSEGDGTTEPVQLVIPPLEPNTAGAR